MNWFNQTFLPSLFSRYGANNPHWLTAKQTSICTDYMVQNTMVESDGYTTIRHKYFTYDWESRRVVLQYSSKNGCGTITFGSTEEEAKEAHIVYRAEKKSREIERLKAQKAHHLDHFMRNVEEARRTVDSLKENIRMDKEEGIETDSYYFEALEKAEKELAFLLSI